MKAEISNKLLRSLTPQNKVYEVRDTSLKGFLLRVEKGGTKTYFIEYARGKRIKLGRADALTPHQARELAKESLGRVFGGKDPAKEKRELRNQHTLAAFIDETYQPWLMENIKSGRSTLERLRKSFKPILSYPLSEISLLHLERWKAARLKTGIKPSTVNRELSDIKACFSRAKAWGFLKENAISDVKLCKVDKHSKTRYLNADELMRLRQALDDREERMKEERDNANEWRKVRDYPLMPSLRDRAFVDHLKPLVLLSLNTGIRRGEALSLRWDSLDLGLKILTVRSESAKSGKTRHIPLNSEALGILKEWREQIEPSCPYVFPGEDGKPLQGIKTSWANLLKEAQISSFRWHDLRHSFASLLVMKGTPLNTVRELLGHSDYEMTLRYAHLAPEHKAAALEGFLDD